MTLTRVLTRIITASGVAITSMVLVSGPGAIASADTLCEFVPDYTLPDSDTGSSAGSTIVPYLWSDTSNDLAQVSDFVCRFHPNLINYAMGL